MHIVYPSTQAIRQTLSTLSSRLAELNQPLDTNLSLISILSHKKVSKTHHPVTALVRLIRHQVREDRHGVVVLLCLDTACQLVHLLDRVRLQQVLIVQVVEENVESLLGVGNVLFVLCRGLGLYALQVCLQNLEDGA
jgi:hypothetical protein